MFVYPSELAETVRGKWTKLRPPFAFNPEPIPDREVLSHILEVAYHASFLTEENRRLRFRIGLCSQAEIDRQARPTREGDAVRFRKIAFAEPRPLSVREILRLAPAMDPVTGLICADHHTARTVSPEIWGLVDTGSSWWDFTHGESGRGSPPPDCLTKQVTNG